MAKNKNNNGPNPNNVVNLPQRCPVEACGKKADKINFCKEHYHWFKAGLVTKEGQKPKDFDKKFAAYERKAA